MQSGEELLIVPKEGKKSQMNRFSEPRSSGRLREADPSEFSPLANACGRKPKRKLSLGKH